MEKNLAVCKSEEIVEKALLLECPDCGTDYVLGWSETDGDGNCRVTCGHCGHVTGYPVQWVE